MSYTIENIEFFVRETRPARIASALGKAGQKGKTAQRVTSPICHVRMILKNAKGDLAFGCSADRLSVRWLDKRPGRGKGLKLRELVQLIEFAGRRYLASPSFDSPFAKWLPAHKAIMQQGAKAGQEELTTAFASALLERALIDGVCRLAGKPFFSMAREDRLGFDGGAVHGELKGVRLADVLPRLPVTHINIRHTVGLFDPLTDEDWPAERRIGDGLPETLQEVIKQNGIRYFKVKISGDPKQDIERLGRIWDVLPLEAEPVVTLDANEAYEDLETFAKFVEQLEREQLGMFQHIIYIEQPLPRRLALAPRAEPWIRRVGEIKPVIIDESDSSLDAFRRARSLGYAGTSHKNCKGVFKSLMTRALIAGQQAKGQDVLLSGEDLQNLPVVPLQQDLAAVGALGLTHCERNGHHYNFGLSMLSEKDKQAATKRHKDLYVKRGDEWFMNIQNGAVNCASLHGPGFGVVDEPDWQSMTPLRKWLKDRYPA